MTGGQRGSLSLQATPHRRFNPLLREWVLVSPHRTQRPWLGKMEEVAPSSALQYDLGCYLCPGNERADGAHNPKYTGTFVFDNDYPALLPLAPPGAVNESKLIVAESEAGNCRVGCFSPRHDLTIAQMSQSELRAVVDMWGEQFQELEKIAWVRHIQIFENRGALMGASNPHPHCQIWTTATLPNIPTRELNSFEEYLKEKKSCLLCDYLQLELQHNERIVCENEAFALVVPFWAVWPFETLVLSKRHFARDERFVRRRTRSARRHSPSYYHAVRQYFQDFIPLLDGLPPTTCQRAGSPGVAFSRALLSAVIALRHSAKIHGGLRIAGFAAAGYYTRNCRAAIGRG